MQFEGALRPMASLGFSTRDLDDVKGIFSDTSLYFLFVTFLVAALHVSVVVVVVVVVIMIIVMVGKVEVESNDNSDDNDGNGW